MSNKSRIFWLAICASYVLWGCWGLAIVAVIWLFCEFIKYQVENKEIEGLTFVIGIVHVLFLCLAIVCFVHAYQVRASNELIKNGWWFWGGYFLLLSVIHTNVSVRKQMLYDVISRRYRRVIGALFFNPIPAVFFLIQACFFIVSAVSR